MKPLVAVLFGRGPEKSEIGVAEVAAEVIDVRVEVDVLARVVHAIRAAESVARLPLTGACVPTQ